MKLPKIKKLTRAASLDMPRPKSVTLFPLEEAYEAAALAVKKEPRDDHFHPSAIGNCSKRNVLRYTGAEQQKAITPRLQDTFDLGHAIHAIVQGRFTNMVDLMSTEDLRVVVVNEIPTPEDDELLEALHIGGTADTFIEIQSRNADGSWEVIQRGIVEIKSSRMEDFDEIVKTDTPNPHHVSQAHIYAYKHNAPLIWIWYFCKNNSKRQLFTLWFDPEIFWAAMDKTQMEKDHADAGTLPEGTESWFECKFCEFSHSCKPKILQSKNDQNMRQIAKTLSRGGFRRR